MLRKSAFFSLASLVVLLIAAPIAWSQTRSGARANYDSVEVRIQLTYRNGGGVPRDLMVQLYDNYGSPTQHEMKSDGRGTVRFRDVRPGIYRVVVKGDNVQDSRGQQFEVMGFSNVHQEMVQVMRNPSEDAAGAPGPPVSAASLKVPQNAREEVEKGMEAFSKGNLDDARKRFQRALEIYPEFAGAYNNLGLIEAQENKADEAKQAFQKAIKADAEYYRAYLNLARLTDKDRNFPETERLLEKYAALNPVNPEALLLLAKSQAAQGKVELALVNCRKVHGLDHAGQAHAHLLAARMLERRDPAAAVQEYKLFLEEAPKDPLAETAKKQVALLQK